MSGAPGSAGQPGAGGSSAGAASAPSPGGSAGAMLQAGGGGSAGSASGGAAWAGAGGQMAGAGGAISACAFQCADQCVQLGGTKKDGSCTGAQICCDGATVTPESPLLKLVPSARELGLLLANRFSKQALKFQSVADLPGDGYKVACEWYGSLGVAKATSTQNLIDSLVTKFNPF
ncbi:MAG TPA: hypothetical protein VGC79_05190, partial [Polyangiaceae bacterium]